MRLNVNIDEKTLLKRCQKKDSKAQFELYERYYKGMYNVALRILNDTAEAEDVMQEAFLSAFDKIKTFNGEVSFGAWLKRIVTNRALDELRKRRVQWEEINERSNAIIDEEDSKTKLEDKVALIEYVVSKMPETNRILLTLHLFEGYPHEEIAEMLQMKHGAVRTGFARAKKKLQEELKEYEFESI